MPEVDWAAICDILAAEYGWTIEYIKTLSLDKISLLIKAMGDRHKIETGDIKGLPKSFPRSGSPQQSSSVLDMANKMGGKIKKDKSGKVKEIII